MKINNEKKQIWTPSRPPLPPIFGVSSADSPLKIWDVVPPYLKTIEQKQKIDNLTKFA